MFTIARIRRTMCIYDAKKKSRLSNIVRTLLSEIAACLPSFSTVFLSPSFHFFPFFILDCYVVLYARRNYRKANYVLVMRFAYSGNAPTTIKRLKEHVAGLFCRPTLCECLGLTFISFASFCEIFSLLSQLSSKRSTKSYF